MAGRPKGLEDFRDSVMEATPFLERPRDGQLTCVNFVAEEGNAMRQMVGPLVRVDTGRAISPGVAARKAEDHVGGEDGGSNRRDDARTDVCVTGVVDKDGV